MMLLNLSGEPLIEELSELFSA